MHKESFCIVLFILYLLSACSHEQDITSSAGNITAIDSLIQKAVDEENIPGGVIRIQQGDSLLHYKAYGFAQKYEYGLEPLVNPKEMTPDHIFDLASLTKVFATTYGIMLLTDLGEIAIDDPIQKYLPGFSEGAKGEITIRHLLKHSSGLAQWYPLYYKASNKKERRKAILEMPLKWAVGEGRHYSDLGFMLLGDIIEKVSGRSLDQFLTEALYQPLDLHYSTFNPLQKGLENIAATSHGNPFEKRMVYEDDFGYEVDVQPESWDGWREYTLIGEVNDGNAWYANNGVAGHAGLFSTAKDLQKLLNLLLDRGRFDGKQIIGQDVIDTFLTKDQYGNGLGWAMDKSTISARGTPDGTFGHTGFTGTNVVIIPENDLTIIFLTNRQNVGLQDDGSYFNLNPLRQEIVDIVIEIIL